MKNNNQLLLIRKQAQIAKASLAELNHEIPESVENIHSRAHLAVDAILAMTDQLGSEKAEAV